MSRKRAPDASLTPDALSAGGEGGGGRTERKGKGHCRGVPPDSLLKEQAQQGLH